MVTDRVSELLEDLFLERTRFLSVFDNLSIFFRNRISFGSSLEISDISAEYSVVLDGVPEFGVH